MTAEDTQTHIFSDIQGRDKTFSLLTSTDKRSAPQGNPGHMEGGVDLGDFFVSRAQHHCRVCDMQSSLSEFLDLFLSLNSDRNTNQVLSSSSLLLDSSGQLNDVCTHTVFYVLYKGHHT